jgi:hypothetical protein
MSQMGWKAAIRSSRPNDASAPTPVIENCEPNFRFGRNGDATGLWIPPRAFVRSHASKPNFHLPEDRTEIQSDLHYQSTETPNATEFSCIKSI